jgi:hypothetical protein
MRRYDRLQQEGDPRYIVFLKRVTVIGTAATVVLGFFNQYLLHPMEVILNHLFKSGGGRAP